MILHCDTCRSTLDFDASKVLKKDQNNLLDLFTQGQAIPHDFPYDIESLALNINATTLWHATVEFHQDTSQDPLVKKLQLHCGDCSSNFLSHKPDWPLANLDNIALKAIAHDGGNERPSTETILLQQILAAIENSNHLLVEIAANLNKLTRNL